MRTMWVLLALFSSAAMAAPVGSPVADPETGRVSLTGTFDTETRVLIDANCAGDDCAAARVPSKWGGRLSLDLLTGVGLFFDSAVVSESIEGAGYSASGTAQGVGIRLAAPVLSGWYLAAIGQLETGSTEAPSDWSVKTDGDEQDQTGSWTHIRATVLASYHRDESFTLYMGPSYTATYSQSIKIASNETAYTFEPVTPVGAVIGIEAFSIQLNAPWSRVRSHLRMGVEGRYEGGAGLAFWTGLGF